jgi:hypothetical protein
MSFSPTGFRPLARVGFGGRAASHFRGLLAAGNGQATGPGSVPQVRGPSWRGQIGNRFAQSVGARVNFRLSGVTRNNQGIPVDAVTVELFLTSTDTLQLRTVSNAAGEFAFDVMPPGLYYIVAYKAGSPDIAGTTVNTLTPIAV